MAKESGTSDLGEPDPVGRIRRAGADVTREPHALCEIGHATANRSVPVLGALRWAPAAALRYVDQRRAIGDHRRDARVWTLGRPERSQRDQPILAHLREV